MKKLIAWAETEDEWLNLKWGDGRYFRFYTNRWATIVLYALVLYRLGRKLR